MSQPTILELADKYAKEYYMGRDEEARKRLQAAIINNETNAYSELKKVQDELGALKACEEAWQTQHWEMAEALTDMLKDFKLLRTALHEVRRATDSKALRTIAETALDATLPTHNIYQDGDENVPEVICDSNGSVTLGLCKTCGRGEIELEEPCIPREVMAYPKKAIDCYRVFKDGDMWCAVGPGFIDLQQSASAFGTTPVSALGMLCSMETVNAKS